MRITSHLGNNIMGRILGALLFVALVCGASDCYGQRQHRGLFNKGARAHKGMRRHVKRPVHDRFSDAEYPTQASASTASGNYQSRSARYQRAMLEAYPKYIGGFHASHYYNVGLPPGDIGFRGNGLYWAPW